jgi:hypothetical protein
MPIITNIKKPIIAIDSAASLNPALSKGRIRDLNIVEQGKIVLEIVQEGIAAMTAAAVAAVAAPMAQSARAEDAVLIQTKPKNK